MTTVSAAEVVQFRAIASVADLALFLRTTARRLQHLLYVNPPSYRTFTIPKANGTARTIEAPPRHIGAMQRRVADAVSSIYSPIRPVHGFVRGRSIVTNARTHVGRGVVLNIDLEDFFWAVHYGRVRGIFKAPPFRFRHDVASALAQLCCANGRLPQGAPSSPVISNLACRGLDRQLLELAKSTGCRYSRYADDLTFSTAAAVFPDSIVSNPFSEPPELGSLLRQIVSASKFVIKDAKVRVRSRRQRQEVTGLTVNRKANVRREAVRSIRGALHYWRVNGLQAAEARFHSEFSTASRATTAPTLHSFLRGKLAFVKMVRCPNDSAKSPICDPVVARYLVELAELSGTRGVLIAGAAALDPFILTRALWIVRGTRDEEELACGTAFALEEHGIVTSAHVIDDHRVTAWTLHPAWAVNRSYPIMLARVSDRLDLAQMAPPLPLPVTLVAAHSRALHSSDLIVAGFPAWSGPADRVRIQRGHVTGLRMLSLVRHLLTSTNIIEGNSGGPALDATGAVAGVVRYGAESVVAPNSCVASQHVAELATHGVLRRLPSRRATVS